MSAVHLAIPFRFEAGRAVTVDQDSLEDISQSVQVLVTTRRGSRLEVPEYGVAPIAFEQSNTPVTTDVLAAAARWEPRARIDVTDQIDSIDDLVRDITVRVRPASVSD